VWFGRQVSEGGTRNEHLKVSVAIYMSLFKKTSAVLCLVLRNFKGPFSNLFSFRCDVSIACDAENCTLTYRFMVVRCSICQRWDEHVTGPTVSVNIALNDVIGDSMTTGRESPF
jgi:hypothetical protein